MQALPTCGRLGLALVLILALGSSVQGYPMRKARYQWVHCSPDSNSANCIEEKGPVFDLPTDDYNEILPSKTDPFLIRKRQNLNDIFPLSEDYPGSGSGSGSSSESESGSGSGFGSSSEKDYPAERQWDYQPLDEKDAFYYNLRPLRKNLPLDNQALGQDDTEEDFII
ncbi:serglycin [Cavia porcellus]|uniref:Serglycin n=1 Tax=Cavia porcellus TaxID=10141 RepID=H0V4Q4_CAVPO|nr:serglycin [Cavia porcellus]XP_013012440.1 serglycin [Cavia porcellus]